MPNHRKAYGDKTIVCRVWIISLFRSLSHKCEYLVQIKKANVIVLYIKGKWYETNNYHPISLFSVFDNFFEKLLCRPVMKFLNDNNILFKFQYGFWLLLLWLPLQLVWDVFLLKETM